MAQTFIEPPIGMELVRVLTLTVWTTNIYGAKNNRLFTTAKELHQHGKKSMLFKTHQTKEECQNSHLIHEKQKCNYLILC